MKSEDQTMREASRLFKAGQETLALKMLRRLAERTEDKALRLKLERLIESQAAGGPRLAQRADVEMFYRPGRR